MGLTETRGIQFPASGDIWMQIDSKLLGKNAYICIFNLMGGIVFNNSISINNLNRISPDLESGTYFISIKSQDGSFENYNGKITVIK